jgi:hypothetical protein
VSYADDSYVVIAADTKDDLTAKTKECFKMHAVFLDEIEMVVNKDKTEMLYSSRTKSKNEELEIHVEDTRIISQKMIKALGVMITADLDWSPHLDYTINKSKYIINRLKFLRKYLQKEDLIRLVTTQFLSIIYYASPLWIGSLQSKSWTRLNSTHYACLRIVIGDHKRAISRRDIDSMTKRATPTEWAKYSIASMVIHLYNNSDTLVANLLRAAAFVNDRLPRRAKFMDRSRLKIGKQSIVNRIGPIFASISFDWIGTFSDDVLRRNLRREFFEYYE